MKLLYFLIYLEIVKSSFVSNLNVTFQDCGSKAYIVYTMTSLDNGFKSLSFNYEAHGTNVDSLSSPASLLIDNSFTCTIPNLLTVNKIGSFFLTIPTLSGTDSGGGFLTLFTNEQPSPYTFYQLVDGRPSSFDVTNLQLNYQDDTGTVVQYPTVNYFPLPDYIPSPCDTCFNSGCEVGEDTGSRTCQAPSPPVCGNTCTHVDFGSGFNPSAGASNCEYDSSNDDCRFSGFLCSAGGDATNCPHSGSPTVCTLPPSPPVCGNTCTHVDFGGGFSPSGGASNCGYDSDNDDCRFSGFLCSAGGDTTNCPGPGPPSPPCYNSTYDVRPPLPPTPTPPTLPPPAEPIPSPPPAPLSPPQTKTVLIRGDNGDRPYTVAHPFALELFANGGIPIESKPIPAGTYIQTADNDRHKVVVVESNTDSGCTISQDSFTHFENYKGYTFYAPRDFNLTYDGAEPAGWSETLELRKGIPISFSTQLENNTVSFDSLPNNTFIRKGDVVMRTDKNGDHKCITCNVTQGLESFTSFERGSGYIISPSGSATLTIS